MFYGKGSKKLSSHCCQPRRCTPPAVTYLVSSFMQTLITLLADQQPALQRSVASSVKHAMQALEVWGSKPSEQPCSGCSEDRRGLQSYSPQQTRAGAYHEPRSILALVARLRPSERKGYPQLRRGPLPVYGHCSTYTKSSTFPEVAYRNQLRLFTVVSELPNPKAWDQEALKQEIASPARPGL